MLLQLFGLLSKLLASLMKNYFPKRPSGAPRHTLSKLNDVPVGFVNSSLIWRLWIALFAVAEGFTVAPISDDLSCSYLNFKNLQSPNDCPV